MLKILHYLVLFNIIFAFIFCLKVRAEEDFQDNFDTKNDSLWNYIPNGGSIIYENGQIDLNSQVGRFPELFSKKDIFGADDSQISIKFKFIPNDVDKYGSKYGPSGDGIGVGYTSSDQSFVFWQFAIWRDRANGDYLIVNDFGKSKNGYCSNQVPWDDVQYRQVPIPIDDLSDNNWNDLTIIYYSKTKSFDILINGKEYYKSDDDQCVPDLIAAGNPLSGANLWNGISIDKISFEKVNTAKFPKIIILPGMGASWNEAAMVPGGLAGAGSWSMTPLVHNYDNLLAALNKNGLKQGTDYWVWNYDWRKRVADIANDFDTFLNSEIGNDDKVVLIGHSLGGLVARNWVQNHAADSRLAGVYSLGGPQNGSVDAYLAWDGGIVSDKFDAEGIAEKVLLQLNKSNYGSDMQTVRHITPVVQDLLPTFDFAKRNGQIVPVAQMSVKNSYLISQNSTKNLVFPFLTSVIGLGESTEAWVNLVGNNVFDRVLGLWPDGEVKTVDTGQGDGLILEKSADLGGGTVISLNSKHGDIPDNSVDMLMESLGLKGQGLPAGNYSFAGDSIFYIGSPATIRINCQGKILDQSQDFLVEKTANVKGCNLEIVGDQNGVYHLVTGNADTDDWQYFENNISTGGVDEYPIGGPEGKVIPDKGTLKTMILADIKALEKNYKPLPYLTMAESTMKQDNAAGTMMAIFGFRLGSKENKISSRIIDNLVLLMSYEKHSKTEAAGSITMAQQEEKMVEMMVQNPTPGQAESYQLLVKAVGQMKNDLNEGDYGAAVAEGRAATYWATLLYN